LRSLIFIYTFVDPFQDPFQEVRAFRLPLHPSPLVDPLAVLGVVRPPLPAPLVLPLAVEFLSVGLKSRAEFSEEVLNFASSFDLAGQRWHLRRRRRLRRRRHRSRGSRRRARPRALTGCRIRPNLLHYVLQLRQRPLCPRYVALSFELKLREPPAIVRVLEHILRVEKIASTSQSRNDPAASRARADRSRRKSIRSRTCAHDGRGRRGRRAPARLDRVDGACRPNLRANARICRATPAGARRLRDRACALA